MAGKVVIADTQYLSRRGLSALVEETALFREVVQTDSRDSFERLLESLPDVVVVDPASTSFNDALLLIAKKSPKSRVVVISNRNTAQEVFDALDHNIDCYLTKSCDADEIVLAFRTVMKGDRFFCNQILEVILAGRASLENCEASILTSRELEVVKLIAKGLTTIGIAKELHLSPHTVYTHRKNIMRKAKVNSAPELVLYAVSAGLIAAR